MTPLRLLPLALLGSLVAAMAAGKPTLFSSYEVVPLRLSAPFNELFTQARQAEDYEVKGTLVVPGGGREVTIDGVKVSLRGHTSMRESECTFPKLKVDLPSRADGATQGTVLEGIGALKLGTHCGERTDGSVTARYGRLPNEHAPLREAFIYRLLDAVGVLSAKARPARITYVYTDPQANQEPDQRQPIVRNAMLLETTDQTLKRLGATSELPVEKFTTARDEFTVADTAMLAFGEAMIGNFDWCIRMFKGDTYRCDARHPLWNVTAIVAADGKARPLMYDFDVSGMVVGRHRWFRSVFNPDFVPTHSPIEIEVVSQVQRTRTLFARADLNAARQRFMDRKSAAYRALESAALDPAGRTLIQQYLDSFYSAIGDDDAFYRPVVAVPGTLPYAEAAGSSPVCSTSGAIPVGTPVGEPMRKTDQRIQVMLLDALWHWAPPVQCAPVHDGPVWIDASAVSTDFPPASGKQH